MDKELLLKYIAGKASQKEKEDIATWIDADAANLKEFISLRKSYDAFIWQDTGVFSKKTKKTISLHPVTQRILRIAAVFVVAFGLSYAMIQVLQKEDIEMQTVYVPAGQRTLVTLADGTTVWVNGKSTLTFPSHFSSRTRTVELDGEAYFDVRKNPEKQFIVSTAHQSAIKVLGTKFNVKAYSAEPNIWITLDEGGILFRDHNAKEYRLVPGESAEYNRQSGKCLISRPDNMEQISAWRVNSLNFYLTPLGEIIKVMERHYDVHFIVKDSAVLKNRFTLSTGKVNASDVLYDLEAVSNIVFTEIEEGVFEVTSK